MCNVVCPGRFPVNEPRIDATSEKDSDGDNGAFVRQVGIWKITRNVLYLTDGYIVDVQTH